jgi:Zn-finger in ubiquitin-hydrolases and other protein
MATCAHLDQIRYLDLPEPLPGCRRCLEMGSTWVHLRMCHTCGEIACCDDSPNRHATAHHHASGHPVIRSAEPGEDWSWCYPDQLLFRLARE